MANAACIWAAALLMSGDRFDELRDVRQSIRKAKAEAAALAVLAHEDLARGAYDEAVERHLRSRALASEAGRLRDREAALVPTLVSDLVRELVDDDVAVRERASRRLVLVGPGAVRALEAVARGGDAEARGRAEDALRRLRETGVDAEGRLRQWAERARASSEYQADSWGARQATGKPDTAQAGDAVTAWASLAADAAEEWIELGYAQPVLPRLVRIHETYNPGAVAKLEARDPSGGWIVFWQGQDPTRGPSGWFEVPVETDVPVRELRITLASGAVPGWNEIDAVELIGEATE